MAGMVQVPFGNATVNRIEPGLPAHAFKTYGVSMPVRTHWISATCEDISCGPYLNGWKTVVPDGSDHAQLIRSADFRRRYRYSETAVEGGLTEFIFPPGQSCFQASSHRVPLERPAVFSVRGGDWRGNPMGIPARVHVRAQDWVEDFSEHQDKIASAIERGQ